MPSPGQTKGRYSLRPLGAAPTEVTACCAGAACLSVFYFDAQIGQSQRHACLKGQRENLAPGLKNIPATMQDAGSPA